jgi:hypothetical protein
MFGWFAPKCPLELSQKVWTEYRMRWLADRLGIDRLLKATVVTPTAEFFPGPYEGNDADAALIYAQMARFMGVTSPPAMQVAAEADMPGALGLYIHGPPPTILLNETALGDRHQVAATFAHELAHEILLGGGLIETTAHDHELVTDLLLVYLGVGITSVNTTIKDRAWREGNLEYFQISRSGYLTAMDFGYALALFAYVRGEDEPAWAAHLRPDAAEVMRKGLRYLNKTGDTVFHPTWLREKLRPPTAAEAHNSLTSGTPTEQIFVLWQLGDFPVRDATLVELVTAKLTHREAGVAAAAADALAALKAFAASAAPHLLAALSSRHSLVRAAAAGALGVVPAPGELVVPALTALLSETKSSVIAAAAYSLANLGAAALPSITAVLVALDAALHRNPHEGSIPRLVHALLEIEDEPIARVHSFYEDGNDEHRDHVVELLQAMRGEDQADAAEVDGEVENGQTDET